MSKTVTSGNVNTTLKLQLGPSRNQDFTAACIFKIIMKTLSIKPIVYDESCMQKEIHCYNVSQAFHSKS